MQIQSLNKLSVLLGVPRSVLEDVSKNHARHYSPYQVRKGRSDGSTKLRTIDNPNKLLRSVQKRINKRLLQPACEILPMRMTGSIRGRSTKDNAAPHVGSEALLLVDLQDCFPSIGYSQVYRVFRREFECTPPVAKVLTRICTFRRRLPQGAPTSPSLCNLVLEPLVNELAAIADTNNLGFTQYIDDLTFSGPHSILKQTQPVVSTKISEHGFRINRAKVAKPRKHERMEVTGLVVNRSVSVGRRYLREIERTILRRDLGPSTLGKIAYVRSVSKKKARKLRTKFRT